MKLAILGTDSAILALIAAAQNNQHEIEWIGDVRPVDTAALTHLTDGLPDRAAQWELLLDKASVDAVLVGKGTASSELRAEQIKRLATESVPLLVVHPAFDTVLTYYEIDMTRREYGAIVQHYNPLIGHPFTAEVAEWVRDGHPLIGPIHQVSCERQLADATREAVLPHFARDAELLAAVAGDIKRVTAIGPKPNDASYASLQVQMNAAAAASVHWTIGYAKTGASGLGLSLRGESGIVAIQIGSPVWQVAVTGEDIQENESLDVFDPADHAIARLARAVGQSQAIDKANASTWEDATRSMEVVDAAELSLQKGRTIEVFQQQLTERLAFRGTMAAIGCGVMLIAFFALVVIAIVGVAEGDVRPKIVSAWSLILLAVLAFFLLLQAVPFLVRRPTVDRSESKPGLPKPRDS